MGGIGALYRDCQTIDTMTNVLRKWHGEQRKEGGMYVWGRSSLNTARKEYTARVGSEEEDRGHMSRLSSTIRLASSHDSTVMYEDTWTPDGSKDSARVVRAHDRHVAMSRKGDSSL